ncbi:MAG: hypothetical protein RL347_514 [Actinomycetota bacterium]
MRARLGAALLAALTLILGFAVASISGNRTLGGVVLVAGGAVCAVLWWRLAGPVRAIAAVAIAGVAFAVSHPLGAVLTSWGAVLLVSAVTAIAAYYITPPPRSSALENL